MERRDDKQRLGFGGRRVDGIRVRPLGDGNQIFKGPTYCLSLGVLFRWRGTSQPVTSVANITQQTNQDRKGQREQGTPPRYVFMCALA